MLDPHMVRVPIARWRSIGVFPENAATLNLSYIEPMLRRRLSPLARAALHVAIDCLGVQNSAQLVYASRHGELQRTVELLGNLANSTPLSPTTFGLSVLNSVAGIFSIARKDQAPATAISAAEETFGFGLIDAVARAKTTHLPVLYLYAEAPAPVPLGNQFADPVDFLVIGILLDPALPAQLGIRTMTDSAEASNEPQAASCIRALAESPLTWSSGRRIWAWKKLD